MKISTAKRAAIFISLALSALLILDSFNAMHALAMFIIVGQIPGTNLTLDADTMLALSALIAGFIVSRLTSRKTVTALYREARYSQPKAATLAK